MYFEKLPKYTSWSVILGFTALATLIFSLIPGGWDSKVTCGCLEAYHAGVNPFYVSLVKQFTDSTLSCTYSILTYLSLTPICSLVKYSQIVGGLFLVVLGFLFLLTTKPSDKKLFYLFSVGGFAGLLSYLVTFNIASGLEFALIALLLGLVYRGYFTWSALVLAFFAYIKLVTIIYFAPLVLTVFFFSNKKKLFQVFAVFSFTYLLLHVVNFQISSEYYLDHMKGLLGLIPNQHNPESEMYSGGSNPTVVYILPTLLSYVGFPKKIFFPIFYLVTVFYVLKISYKNRAAFEKSYLEYFCFWFLSFSLILPRMKPYFYLSVAPIVFFLIQNWSTQAKNKIFWIFAVLPCLLLWHYKFAETTNFLGIVVTSYQSVLLVYIYYLVIKNGSTSSESAF